MEQDSAFKQVSQEARKVLSRKYGELSEGELFHSYVEYVKMLYDKYDNIKTPQLHSSKNVIVEGIPSTGKFLRFTLSDQCKVYYLVDKSSLNEYWGKHFGKLKKLDNHWYYQISGK